MAIHTVDASVSTTAGFSAALSAVGSGGTPYPDGRALASMMGDHIQIATGTVTLSGGDGLEVTLGFAPKFLWAYNVTDAVTWTKTDSLAATAALKRIAAGDLTAVGASLSFAKIDTTAYPNGGFTVVAAIATTSDVWHYAAFG